MELFFTVLSLHLGVAGRGARYSANCRRLVDGMRDIGFESLLPDQLQAAGAEDEDQPSTSLHTRAIPLLELLEASVADECAVRWE